MPPVVAIVGIGSSGKTTFTTRLVSELKSRGYHVATIKHAPAGMALADEGKDSWQHIKAGSEATAVSAPDKMVLVRPAAREFSLDEVVHFIGDDFDIVLAEGFKHSDVPKIEVHRRSVGPPLTGLTRLLAMVTDEHLDTDARQFAIDDARGIADLLEKGFILPGKERIAMWVNGSPVVLTQFPREVISNVVVALAASLKGVGDIRSIDISLKKDPNRGKGG